MKNSLLSVILPAVVSAILVCFLASTASAQSIARLTSTINSATTTQDRSANAITALRRLQDRVIVYRSMGEFEESGRLARVSLQMFERELRDVTAEVEPIISRMPQSRLRDEIVNALASYRDGAFWWRKIDQPRVLHVSALRFDGPDNTPAEVAFRSNIPYTVAIHWRQAAQYLNRAEALLGEPESNQRVH